jgi:DNA-binding response OmpR family regulator
MKTILIIDDDTAVLELFCQFFEQSGFAVQQAENGKTGLIKMRQSQPDLIITDIMMPEMDGLEIIQEVRAHTPELPVIAISGGMRNATMNFLPHAKKFGAIRVFEKPVILSELLEAVCSLLSSDP